MDKETKISVIAQLDASLVATPPVKPVKGKLVIIDGRYTPAFNMSGKSAMKFLEVVAMARKGYRYARPGEVVQGYPNHFCDGTFVARDDNTYVVDANGWVWRTHLQEYRDELSAVLAGRVAA